jgi:hypothetical protein
LFFPASGKEIKHKKANAIMILSADCVGRAGQRGEKLPSSALRGLVLLSIQRTVFPNKILYSGYSLVSFYLMRTLTEVRYIFHGKPQINSRIKGKTHTSSLEGAFMGNQESYDKLIGVIKAIPENEIQEPNMPVETAAQEAENLHDWALPDKAYGFSRRD